MVEKSSNTFLHELNQQSLTDTVLANIEKEKAQFFEIASLVWAEKILKEIKETVLSSAKSGSFKEVDGKKMIEGVFESYPLWTNDNCYNGDAWYNYRRIDNMLKDASLPKLSEHPIGRVVTESIPYTYTEEIRTGFLKMKRVTKTYESTHEVIKPIFDDITALYLNKLIGVAHEEGIIISEIEVPMIFDLYDTRDKDYSYFNFKQPTSLTTLEEKMDYYDTHNAPSGDIIKIHYSVKY